MLSGFCRLYVGVPASHFRSIYKSAASQWKVFHTGESAPNLPYSSWLGDFVNTVFKGELNIDLFETLHAVRQWITGNDDQALERIISTVCQGLIIYL